MENTEVNASGNNVKISIGRTSQGELSFVVPTEFGSLCARSAEFLPDGRIRIVLAHLDGVRSTHQKSSREGGTQYRLSAKRLSMKLPRNYPISGRSHDSLHAAMAIAYGPSRPGTHGAVDIADLVTTVKITTTLPVASRYLASPVAAPAQPLPPAPPPIVPTPIVPPTARGTGIIADGKQLIALANEWVKMARAEGVTPKLSIADDGLLSISVTTAMSL